MWHSGGNKRVGEYGLCEVSSPVRQESNAREVCEDEEERAEVVRRLNFCWPRGGTVADFLGDEKVREVCVELHFVCQR